MQIVNEILKSRNMIQLSRQPCFLINPGYIEAAKVAINRGYPLDSCVSKMRHPSGTALFEPKLHLSFHLLRKRYDLSYYFKSKRQS